MKQMLILTGPQGAGNHLWSKIFSLHSEVYGWKTLLDNYWEAHRFKEPFALYWKDPAKLKNFDWDQSNYYFTSISCPLGIVGHNSNPLWNPNIKEFSEAVRSYNINVEFAIVGRDKNILNYQQTRIRTRPTIDLFLEQLDSIPNPTFLSYELLYLYKSNYLRSLQFNIPLAYNDSKISSILDDDPNAKYVHHVEYSELDNGNKTGQTFKIKP